MDFSKQILMDELIGQSSFTLEYFECPGEKVDFSFIVTSWKSKDDLLQCLSSLSRSVVGMDLHETIVVEASSTDEIVNALQKLPYEVSAKLNLRIEKCEDRGWSHSVNVGIGLARGRWLIVANQDIIFDETNLMTLLGFARRHPEVHFLVPLLASASGEKRLMMRKLTFSRMFFVFTNIGSFFDAMLGRRVYKDFLLLEADYETRKGFCRLEHPWMSLFVARRTLFDRLGQLDEAFWLYFADSDFVKRCAIADVPMVGMTSAVFHHSFAQSIKTRGEEGTLVLFFRDMLEYSKKWHVGFRMLRILLTLDALFGPIITLVRSPAWFKSGRWIARSKVLIRVLAMSNISAKPTPVLRNTRKPDS